MTSFMKLVQTRRGLEIIIDAAATLFDQRSLQRLAEGVLTQLSSLMAVECAGILVLRETGIRRFKVLAGSGAYRKYATTDASDEVEDSIAELIHEAFDRRCHVFTPGRYLLYMGTGSGRELIALMDAEKRAFRHRQGAGRGVLQPSRRSLRQRDALRGAGDAPTSGSRRRWRGAPLS